MIGVDLFSGAGGMSWGARSVGIEMVLAIDNDKYCIETYNYNHKNVGVVCKDIREIESIDVSQRGDKSILIGGPPCKGFSVSNQRTRDFKNADNYLFLEYVRLLRLWGPDYFVLENVKGLAETKSGVFLRWMVESLKNEKYRVNVWRLNAVNYGVPQNRNRIFIVGSKSNKLVKEPKPHLGVGKITVWEAIGDLPELHNGADKSWMSYSQKEPSGYAKELRNNNGECANNIVTKNAEHIIKRYKHVPQGGNWEDIPISLMKNYTDIARCHTGIYKRLREDLPSVVICNYRKNMLIHPRQHRQLSVREAARIQSFHDSFVFMGSIGYQQQQVSNAVPPRLAEAVLRSIVG